MSRDCGRSDQIVLVDSINQLDSTGGGKPVVAGSHGGVYPAYMAAVYGSRGVILNDAGIGFENSGVACLGYCENIGMAAAVVSHHSARIGDAKSMMESGIISAANRIAENAGCRSGIACCDAVLRLWDAPIGSGSPPPYNETRFLISDEMPRIVCIDSASLVEIEDAGQIVITGSHGGLIGGRPEKAFNIDATLAVFNDAGVGLERAGIGRLWPLQERGIAAVTVSNMSARLGDSRSSYENGIISHANAAAEAMGASPGLSLKVFVHQARKLIAQSSPQQ
ncbi:MAG: hypothetical protein EA383_15185 [Spirochaetaceae bacterium]|nr:MAG: hypothetical protein EA383_15185 [Spirochaetaceae bacterium]